jgi:phospholipase C
MPPNVRRVLAQAQARRGSFREIKHVVVLMQENRSFDHYFGTMAGVRGFDDPGAPKLPDGPSCPLVLARYGAANVPKPVIPSSQEQPPMREKGHRNRVRPDPTA